MAGKSELDAGEEESNGVDVADDEDETVDEDDEIDEEGVEYIGKGGGNDGK